MNTKLFSLLVFSALLTSAFAMDQDQGHNSAGVKRSLQTAFEAKDEKTAKLLKPSIDTFLIQPSTEVIDGQSISFSIQDKLGKLDELPSEVFLIFLSFADPRDIMGINSFFYTKATGYTKKRMLLTGCGSDKEPDYSRSLFSLSSKGIAPAIRIKFGDFMTALVNTKRKYIPYFDFIDQFEELMNPDKRMEANVNKYIATHLTALYTPEMIPSSSWYVLLKSVAQLPAEFYPYLGGTNVREFNGFSAADNKIERMKLLCENLANIEKLALTLNLSGDYGDDRDDEDDGENELDLLGKRLSEGNHKVKIIDLSTTTSLDEPLIDFFSALKGIEMDTIFYPSDTDAVSVHRLLPSHKDSKVKAVTFSKCKFEEDDDDEKLDPQAIAQAIKDGQIEVLSFSACDNMEDAVLPLVKALLEKNASLKKLVLKNGTIKDEAIKKSLLELVLVSNLEIVFEDNEELSEAEKG